MATKVVKEKRAPRTPKEKAFAKEYIANGGNGTRAALKVYDVSTINSANVIAQENLRKLTIIEMMDTVDGLRPVDRLKVLAEGLYATKSDQYTGEVQNDYSTRYKYLELSFKLDKSLGADDTGKVQNFNQFILNQKNTYSSD